jgi:hypothetical protein
MPFPTPDQTYFPGLLRYLSFVDESGHSRDPKRNRVCITGRRDRQPDCHAFDTRLLQISFTEPSAPGWLVNLGLALYCSLDLSLIVTVAM